MSNHKQKAAQFLITAFGVVVLAISASTSFGFFFNFFDALIPHELLGRTLAAIVSGIVGVLLFDVACAVWLNTYLHHAETAEQRAVTLIMTLLTFSGAAAASVAHLGLTADGQLAIDPAAAEAIATFSLGVVIIGVVANFGAFQAYTRFSYENKIKVRESDRRDAVQGAEDEQAAYLDELVTQQVKELLTAQAPTLAEHQARRIAARFSRHEQAKYADGEQVAEEGDGAKERAPREAPLLDRLLTQLQDDDAALDALRQRLAANAAPGGKPDVPFGNGRGA